MVWPFGARHRLNRLVSVEPTLASQIPERQCQIPMNDIKITFLPLNGIFERLRMHSIPLRVVSENTELRAHLHLHGVWRRQFVFQ
jgi:hypothetical protein